ncbi:von Willebrand factor A domain-containing protein 8-like [Ylistrum balloti]|uniref:von Willebrand factor A domain-containing protein 8-like n=1 Tax=Ylistrum balloti TaxID=509963 RepID=UPI002905B628|nr:von Willebrand factor A domain-containing protein 8-like [Ylistrum balloti]
MFRLARMSVDRSIRRLKVLQTILHDGYASKDALLAIRWCSDSATKEGVVSIGDITLPLRAGRAPELIPVKYLPENPPQSVLRHLRWIMQKDAIGQDVFLIGPPGPLRRQIAMMYLELTKREGEYISLSRDTTESDLKQRREIRSGTAFYLDQCAVRAALEGRILILEGIEKAERNVLPILNNLLENREMQLDDGRFLMAADRYDKLLTDHTQAELDQLKLVRVSENFRVLALGHPVPRYQGNPLDPPLRSRFQSRDITSPPFKELLDSLQTDMKNVPPQRLSQMLSFATAIITKESSSLGLPDFPISNLVNIIRILDSVPIMSSQALLQILYPYNTMLGKDGKVAVERILQKFELMDAKKQKHLKITSIKQKDDGSSQVVLNERFPLTVNNGLFAQNHNVGEHQFVTTKYHESLLAELMMSHTCKDLCIVGPKGSGKSALVGELASLLGYRIEPIMLYQDMTSRDLLQQRITLPNGDTSWRLSPLVTAAIEGSLAVLDGVHRINQGSFSILHRLIHDRDLQLLDGSRLLRHDRYQEMKKELNLTDEQMSEKGILPIHPSFRMIALSEPPVAGSTKQQWMTPELLTMFLFHNLRPLSKAEELEVIHKVVKNSPDMNSLISFVHKLRTSTDPAMASIASSLSTRQLIRVAKRVAQFPSKDLYGIVEKACLARFLPQLPKAGLHQSMENEGIKPIKNVQTDSLTLDQSITSEVNNGMLRIGHTTVPLFNPNNKTKVPDVLFYDNPQHLGVMEDMLKDFSLGENLLLVGNQGVGKNKIVDRFLYLLNRPREYLQLHRDTTVQTLTLQPTVKDGVIVYEDSPLVSAVKQGNVLVVDEADKAPTHVTCILKTLVESKEMHLADGRRIVSPHSSIPPSENIIKCHPDFRMIVLANRPGFPFLGNDFFGSMGDIFSCHAIDNPDMESELAMLRQYGPNVPETTLKKLVQAFGELRNMADQGLIAYPYSTREVVNIVKHIQKYPDEGLTTVVRNVFDFDSYSNELKDTIVQTMHKHGIPFGATEAVVNLAKQLPLPSFRLTGKWDMQSGQGRRKTAMMSLPVESSKVQFRGPIEVAVQATVLEKREARAGIFTEQDAFWTIPVHENNIISGVAVTKKGNRSEGKKDTDVIHIATSNPVSLYSLNPKLSTVTHIDMYDLFPTTSGSYQPRVNLAPKSAPFDNTIILHEEVSNAVFLVNFESGEIGRIRSPYLPETVVEKRRFPSFQQKKEKQNEFRMCHSPVVDGKGTLIFYKVGGDTLVAITGPVSHSVSLPFAVESIHQVSPNQWLVTSTENHNKNLITCTDDYEFILRSVQEEGQETVVDHMATVPLSEQLLKSAIKKDVTSVNRVIVTPDTYASVLVGFPDGDASEVYSTPRELVQDDSMIDRMSKLRAPYGEQTDAETRYPIVYLPESGMVVQALPSSKVPLSLFPDGKRPSNNSGFLEITDLGNRTLRYIPVPAAGRVSSYASWIYHSSSSTLHMAPTSNDGVVTVDVSGCVRLWEPAVINLERSLQEWKNMIGFTDGKELQITYERESGRKADGPKHGKIDKTNAPHVGGNQWAGGTGGSNTAGLGGLGGPYRLDAGHKVYQVPQAEKDAVPEEVRQAAREMAQKAFKDRLREINMSEYDAETYNNFLNHVRGQVQSLRVILDSLQAKGKERQWLKNQAYGDLDDAKLIEGITGEKSIYKRRGEKEPELGTPQEKPKRMRLVVDVSGSMYRFNGYDGRLEREMEATLMMMEALDGYDEKIKYDILGHSGEDFKVQLVKPDKVPANNKERLVVLKTMHAHSQFCLSGDNTLEATRHAIKGLSEEEADEHFVIVLSDANFDRYNISPKKFGEILRSNDKVNAYTIFIGSLEDQASQLIKHLPSGHAFICLDTKDLPQILQQIFTSTMLSSS